MGHFYSLQLILKGEELIGTCLAWPLHKHQDSVPWPAWHGCDSGQVSHYVQLTQGLRRES